MQSESTAKRSRVADENRAVVRRLFERVYSKGELSRIDDVATSDFVGESTESSHPYFGPAGIRRHVIRLRTAFHEFTIGIDDLYVRGDTFEVSWTARGTHEGRFQGADPTCTIGQAGQEPHGNHIAVSGETRGTMRDGKIREIWMAWDAEELRHQLGAPIEAVETDTGDRVSTGQNPALLEGPGMSTHSSGFVSRCI